MIKPPSSSLSNNTPHNEKNEKDNIVRILFACTVISWFLLVTIELAETITDGVRLLEPITKFIVFYMSGSVICTSFYFSDLKIMSVNMQLMQLDMIKYIMILAVIVSFPVARYLIDQALICHSMSSDALSILYECENTNRTNKHCISVVDGEFTGSSLVRFGCMNTQLGNPRHDGRVYSIFIITLTFIAIISSIVMLFCADILYRRLRVTIDKHK